MKQRREMTDREREQFAKRASPDCASCDGTGVLDIDDGGGDSHEIVCECVGYLEPERERGEDDGQEYGHPADRLAGLE